jgi:predicted nucleic acid-binding Zn ribbon protein
MDGSLGHFKSGQQRKAERNKIKGKFDPRKTNNKSGRAIKSSKKLSKAELDKLIADLNYKSQKRKKNQLKLLFLILVVISLMFILTLL